MAKELFLGAMSGTSLDGLDIALCELDIRLNTIHLITATTTVFPDTLRTVLYQLCHQQNVDFDFLYQTEQHYSQFCADATNKFLEQNNLSPKTVAAYGFHGQTIRHHPDKAPGYTLQIGDLSKISAHTGLRTVGDFRRKDIALGGQGAPFAPAFHQAFFADPDEHRVIANIGGISNISVLSQHELTSGFDTGPGNALLDYWFQKHNSGDYDASGHWAKQGRINAKLLTLLLEDNYFSLSPPKSTGRELFNSEWLDQKLSLIETPLLPQDIQATLTEFTAYTLSDAINRYAPKTNTIYVCGGGSHNTLLMERLRHLSHKQVDTTEILGINPDWIEAAAFAWLAANRLHNKPIKLTNITGASKNAVYGGIYEP